MTKSVLSDAKAGLLDLMKRRGEITVEEGADALDLAKTTIRQHLSRLEEQELVETRNERHGRGRPRKMYRLAEKSRSFFPSNEPELLQRLLEYLVEHGREDLIEDFLSEEAEKVAEELRQALGDDQTLDVEILQEQLSARGFLPRCTEEESDVIVEFCHCPYAAAVEVTTEVCKNEMELLETFLEGSVRREAFMPDGDVCCRYRVSRNDSDDTN